jgi:DNA-binding response OmpR family regulator
VPQLVPSNRSGNGGGSSTGGVSRNRIGEPSAVGSRVLVVEDEFLLSTLLEQDLRDAGYDVIGPYFSLSTAMAAAQSELFDVAILDINLRGELVYPVAEELARRKIPFLFLSGYALANMPQEFRTYPRLAKPTDLKSLLRTVATVLRGKAS